MSYKKSIAKSIFLSIVLTIWATNPTSAATAPGTTAAPATAAQHPRKPFSYRIAGSERHAYRYDAKPEIQAYTELVADSYAAAFTDAGRLKAAIDGLLAAPDDQTLTRARDAWLIARRAWEMTEAFRFYDGPIDLTDSGPGPQARMDGWPVDAAAIDYIDGNPTAGIINDMKLAMTRATLLERQSRPGPDRAVTTGWHVLEFLLWGQEPASLGEPGDRPPTDYLPGQPNNDRRRTYLRITAEILLEDLRYLVEAWEPKSRNYAAEFRVLNQRDALGRILNGAAQLAARELATDRLAAALDSKDRRTLTSRFSQSSYQDFIFALRGIRNLWGGDFGAETRPGLGGLIARSDAPLAQRIDHALNHAENSVAALYTPLDRDTLPEPENGPARQAAERAIADLKRLASLLRDAGVGLGIAVDLPN